MKLNKRPVFRILSLAVLFCLVFTACTPQVSPGSSEVETPSSQVSSGEVPVSTPEEITPPPPKTVDLRYGTIEFPGIMFHSEEERLPDVSGYFREFDYPGGELKANLCLGAEKGGIAEVGVLLFCDGVPMEYTVLESGETGVYHVFQVEGERIVQITFKPDFDLDLGRIDLHLVRQPNEKAPSMWGTNQTAIHAVLPEGYVSEGIYSSTIGNGEDTRIVAMSDTFKSIKNNMTQLFVMDPWIKEEKIGNGKLEFKLTENTNTWICLSVPTPGTYRLAFLLDGEPIALEDGKTVLHCEFGEDEMFSTKVPLQQMVSEGEHSLIAIATQVDRKSFQDWKSSRSSASFQYLIVN